MLVSFQLAWREKYNSCCFQVGKLNTFIYIALKPLEQLRAVRSTLLTAFSQYSRWQVVERNQEHSRAFLSSEFNLEELGCAEGFIRTERILSDVTTSRLHAELGLCHPRYLFFSSLKHCHHGSQPPGVISCHSVWTDILLTNTPQVKCSAVYMCAVMNRMEGEL